MSNGKLAFIGGSGLYDFSGIEIVNRYEISSPFGGSDSEIIEFKNKEGENFFFLPRHAKGHTVSPSEINYRAHIFALKKLGVKHIISFSAVGSLKEEYEPGSFVLVDQYIDMTKGFRKKTFFEDGMVGHVSLAEPISIPLKTYVENCISDVDVRSFSGGTYICIEGPQFSTKAESHLYRSWDCDVIGMTNLPEAHLAKEAGISYASVCMITDYDCWKDEHCTLEAIMSIMKGNKEKAVSLIKKIVTTFYKEKFTEELSNQNAVVTDENRLDNKHKDILRTLLS